MYQFLENNAGRYENAWLMREPDEIREETERIRSELREVGERLGALWTCREEITDSFQDREDSEQGLYLLEILLDGIQDAEAAADELQSELSALSDELEDSLWALKRESEEM